MAKRPVIIGPYHFSKKGDAAAFLQQSFTNVMLEIKSACLIPKCCTPR